MDEICDRCTTSADTVVHLRSGGVLALCESHAGRHRFTLMRQGAVLTALLAERPVAVQGGSRTGVPLQRLRPPEVVVPQRRAGLCTRAWAWLSDALMIEQGR